MRGWRIGKMKSKGLKRGLGQRMFVLREEAEKDWEKNRRRDGYIYDGGRRKMNFRTWVTQGEGTMLEINEKTEKWSRRGKR